MKSEAAIIVILGPTASGKTRLAAHVAAALQGEIISVDSRQVFREMDIGTGKDYQDYRVGDAVIPCHLVDIAEPGTEYSLYRFQQDFYRSLNDIYRKGRVPIACGGTGLYLHSILKGYDLEDVPENKSLRALLALMTIEELREKLLRTKVPHNRTDLDDRNRLIRAIEIEAHRTKMRHPGGEEKLPGIQDRSLVFGIQFERDVIRERITKRLEQRLKEGLIEEVNGLLDKGLTPERLEAYGLEYRFVTWFLTGRITYNELFEKLNTAIHQFSKRQMTWFRKMEREGVEIRWIDGMIPIDGKVRIICEAASEYKL